MSGIRFAGGVGNVPGSVIGGSVKDNSQAGAGSYSGIELMESGATGIAIRGVEVSGANHLYSVVEGTVGASYPSNNHLDGTGLMAVGTSGEAVHLISPTSFVHDDCAVKGEFNWLITDGTASKTITGLTTGSCPQHWEFFAGDLADTKVFSRGSDDGTNADCMFADENSVVDSASGASIMAVNAAGDGFSGLISLLGAAAGTQQDQVVIDMTKIVGGRDIKVKYKAWR